MRGKSPYKKGPVSITGLSASWILPVISSSFLFYLQKGMVYQRQTSLTSNLSPSRIKTLWLSCNREGSTSLTNRSALTQQQCSRLHAGRHSAVRLTTKNLGVFFCCGFSQFIAVNYESHKKRSFQFPIDLHRPTQFTLCHTKFATLIERLDTSNTQTQDKADYRKPLFLSESEVTLKSPCDGQQQVFHRFLPRWRMYKVMMNDERDFKL